MPLTDTMDQVQATETSGSAVTKAVMTQAEFARDRGVTRQCVYQWKKTKILRDDAFVEVKGRTRINVAVAVEQLRKNRNLGQSLGNGIGTRTDVPEPEAAALQKSDGGGVSPGLPLDPGQEARESIDQVAPPAGPEAPSVEDLLKRARLDQQLAANRREAIRGAVEARQLVAADEERARLARIAAMMMQIFEGAMPEMATAVAADHGVPQRDVLHTLKQTFGKVRETAARKMASARDGSQEVESASVRLDTDAGASDG